MGLYCLSGVLYLNNIVHEIEFAKNNHFWRNKLCQFSKMVNKLQKYCIDTCIFCTYLKHKVRFIFWSKFLYNQESFFASILFIGSPTKDILARSKTTKKMLLVNKLLQEISELTGHEVCLFSNFGKKLYLTIRQSLFAKFANNFVSCKP